MKNVKNDIISVLKFARIEVDACRTTTWISTLKEKTSSKRMKTGAI